jgi:DnaJ-class molecular chaperone
MTNELFFLGVQLDRKCENCNGTGRVERQTEVCPFCNGTQYELTEGGRELSEFIQRHLSSLNLP